MSRTRIAVAGAGLIGLRHIEEIQKSESAELAAIVDIMSQAVGVAEKEGVALFGSLAELFAEGNAQGVILATPNKLHVDQGLECVAAGMPALIEKPVAHNYPEGVRFAARPKGQARRFSSAIIAGTARSCTRRSKSCSRASSASSSL